MGETGNYGNCWKRSASGQPAAELAALKGAEFVNTAIKTRVDGNVCAAAAARSDYGTNSCPHFRLNRPLDLTLRTLLHDHQRIRRKLVLMSENKTSPNSGS